MPREREEFFRESNIIEKEKIFVLAFEGNKTEEIYFSEFKDSNKFNGELIYLHLLKRKKNDTRSAPIHVFNKLKREAKDEFNFNSDDEFWMIIDTDRWKNIQEIVAECEQMGNMFVAVSKPCFELWLLLHVKNIDDYTNQELLQIIENKKETKKKTFIEIKLKEILGGYNKSNIKPKLFLPHLHNAILQAKKLDTPEEKYPSKIGSHIYKLMIKIIKD